MDFQKVITVKVSSEKVFEAVTTGINSWWGNVDNARIEKVGDEFSIFFEENTIWRFVISKMDRFEAVHWTCVHAYHAYGGLKGIEKEWLNSKIKWQIKDLKNGETQIRFEHIGLTPELNCYDICHAGWTHFVASSLKQYLETGKGLPNLVEA